jgi:hypothetical protein
MEFHRCKAFFLIINRRRSPLKKIEGGKKILPLFQKKKRLALLAICPCRHRVPHVDMVLK